MADTERWQRMLETASEAARTGGRILQDWRSEFSVSEKSRANLVTEADFASQQAIYETLKGAFPEHGFLGEEGLSEAGADPDYRWIIDPLDGTGNYVHGFPYYCVSIGLEYQGRMVVGAIYDPTREELFSAVEGAGAWRDHQRIRVSETDQLRDAMCVASLPNAADPANAAFRRFVNVLPEAQSLQRFGSAAMNLAYVACGALDAFWSTTLYPWDIAAGVIIVQEAGGVVTQLDGTRLDIEKAEILTTATPALQKELMPYLNEA